MRHNISLSSAGIEKSIILIEQYQKKIENGCKELIRRLGERGVEIGNVRFGQAIYSGTNDVEVDVKFSDKSATVTANGKAVLFIEFGAGITYAETHPEVVEGVVPHGQYGKGKGRNPNGWTYNGDPGNAGEQRVSRKGIPYVHTYGNPSNNSLYHTKKDLEKEFIGIAKECFK